VRVPKVRGDAFGERGKSPAAPRLRPLVAAQSVAPQRAFEAFIPMNGSLETTERPNVTLAVHGDPHVTLGVACHGPVLNQPVRLNREIQRLRLMGRDVPELAIIMLVRRRAIAADAAFFSGGMSPSPRPVVELGLATRDSTRISPLATSWAGPPCHSACHATPSNRTNRNAQKPGRAGLSRMGPPGFEPGTNGL
jgi:hypothetical protein